MKRSSSGSPVCFKNQSLANMTTTSKSADSHNARPYQIEIFEKAKCENTVVCLGTGTGKTFISIMLIKEKQNKIKGKLRDGGKRTFFLVNTVPLAEQQHHAIKEHTELVVKFFTGDMGVDFWDAKRWEMEFNDNDVLVMTAQILVNILNSGFISIANINLLILDECHNATKKHPYVRVMERFLDAQICGLELPHVMGLTASIINEKYKKPSTDFYSIQHYLSKKMKELESTMKSKCLTCSDPEATSSYAVKPVEMIVPYSVGYDINDFNEVHEMIESTKETLQSSVTHFELKRKKYIEDKQELKSATAGLSADVFRAVINRTSFLGFKDGCSIAVDAVKYCSHILETLGPLCAYEAACILKPQLENHKRRFACRDKSVIEECIVELNNLIEKYENCVARGPFQVIDNVIPTEPFITKKAHTFLKDVLLKEKRNFQKMFKTDLHAIVFVQRRCTAVILNKLINLVAKSDLSYRGLSSNFVLGHGLDENVRLADSFMRSSQQSSILNNFKQSKFNVLVSTSVVEEGLDVRKCNLVVRFDGMSNYREYAQSKGRARAKKSKFIVMSEEEAKEDMEKQLVVMQNIEKVLFENCQNRQAPTHEESEKQLFDEIAKIIPTIISKDGNAQIPHHCSVALLFRFCSCLPRDKYTNTYPKFYFRKREVDGVVECQAECRLPHNFPIEPRICKGEWMTSVVDDTSEELAKKQLATWICQKLLDNGELTDENLLPKKHKHDCMDDDDFFDEVDKTIEGTRKNRAFYERKVPNVLTKSFKLEDCDLYAISITLSDPYDKPSTFAMWPLWYGDEKEGFGIFLPKGITENLPSFNLYTKNGGFAVEFTKIPHRGIPQVEKIKSYHAFLCQKFFKPYVYGDLHFDDGNCAELSKGYLVPLKSIVFNNITRGKCLDCDTPVDYQRIKETLNLLESNKLPGISYYTQPVIHKTYLDEHHNKRLYYIIGPSENQASDIMEGKRTFVDYYRDKYKKTINPNSQLLKAINASSVVASYSENLDWKENVKEGPPRIEELVPELCDVASILSAQHHIQIHMLPFIFYKLESLLNAKELQERLSNKLEISNCGSCTNEMDTDVEILGKESSSSDMKKMQALLRSSKTTGFYSPTALEIFEATTTRQASFSVDLERLEMLGDAFLKQAVSIYLFVKYPRVDEGRLTKFRKDCISNKNLCGVALDLNIQHSINNSTFGVTHKDSENKNPVTVWLPPSHHRSLTENTAESSESFDINVDPEIQWKPFQEVQDKSLADCIEALIGVYFKAGGVNLALRFMSSALKIPCLFRDIEDKNMCKIQKNTKSIYGDFPKQSSAISNEEASIEDVLELYEKGRFSRLEQTLGYTFQDKSHIVRAMTHPSYDDNQVTRAYEEYEYLGDAILDFLVTLHIYSIKKELSPGELTSIKSALVNNNVFSFYTIKLKLHKYMLHLSNGFFHDSTEFARMVEEGSNEESAMEDLFESPFIVAPPGSEEGFMAPKVMGDLVESLAGAIFLDSALDLMKVWEVFFPIMEPIINKYIKSVPLSPKRQLHETYSNVRFEFPDDENEMNNDDTMKCIVYYGDGQTEVGIGKSKKIAKMMASYRVLKKEKRI